MALGWLGSNVCKSCATKNNFTKQKVWIKTIGSQGRLKVGPATNLISEPGDVGSICGFHPLWFPEMLSCKSHHMWLHLCIKCTWWLLWSSWAYQPFPCSRRYQSIKCKQFWKKSTNLCYNYCNRDVFPPLLNVQLQRHLSTQKLPFLDANPMSLIGVGHKSMDIRVVKISKCTVWWSTVDGTASYAVHIVEDPDASSEWVVPQVLWYFSICCSGMWPWNQSTPT